MDLQNAKIAVVGIGGVGGYLAGMLCRAYPNVTLVARNESKPKIENDGLILHSDYNGEITAKPKRVCLANELEPQDFIFVCVKNYSLEDVCDQIGGAVDENTIIIPVMNGVDPGDRIRKIMSTKRVVDSLIYIVSFVNADFSVTQQGNFAKLFIGIQNASETERKMVEAVSYILKGADIDNEISDDIESQIWRKYILNCAYNVATAYYNQTIGQLRDDKIKSLNYEMLVWEAYSVCKAKNINLPQKDVDHIIYKFYNEHAYDSTSSLMRDYRDGNKNTELETFCGYIVREAEKYGIHVQLTRGMYEELLQRTVKN